MESLQPLDALASWHEFGGAMAGVTGALAGLLIVAMSVNIEVIVASKTLPARSGAAIATLILTVALSCLILVPGTPLFVYGIEVLVLTAAAWVFEMLAARRVVETNEAGMRSRSGVLLLGIIPLAAFTLGGVGLVAGLAAGMYLVAAACVLAICSAVMISWVTLVEVRR
jgi:hypothetical protein